MSRASGFVPALTSLFLALLLLAPLVGARTLSAEPLPEVPAEAFGEDAYDRGEPRVEKRFYLDRTVAAPGERITMGVLFSMDPGWHIYWHNPGQGGMETEAFFESSAGAPGPVQWPTPGVYHEANGAIITFGYSNQVMLFTELEVPDGGLEELRLEAEVDYLVCEVDCIPGRAELERTLPVGIAEPAPEEVQALFAQNRERLPLSREDTSIEAQWRFSKIGIQNPDEFRIELSVIGCHDAGDEDCQLLGAPPERAADAFVYERLSTVRLEIARVTPHPEAHSGWFIEIRGRTTGDQPTPGADQLRGVLRLVDDQGQSFAVFTETLFPWEENDETRALLLSGADLEGDGALPLAPGPVDPGITLFTVLLLALLGGALLNLMPCVFPVLAIKVFSFVSVVHEERQSIYLHAAAYTAGIVASMMVLAAAVIALQLLGTQVGWGFQFQEPLFIAIVGAILVVFALNLFGVFEVTLSPGKLQQVALAKPSARRSFGEGVLAVILATPCSAPFLGTAVGFALASSPVVILLIFFVLGLGLALPFAILTLVPGAAKILPKPGAWMNHFKQFLGFALLGTAIWLLWLIGQMEGINAVTRLLAFFLATSIAAWTFGIGQYKSRGQRLLSIAIAVVILSVAALFTLQFSGESSSAGASASQAQTGPIPWQEWSEEAVQAELAAGRAVFVDFTADWCITCKVNEANVLENPRVVAAMEEYEIAMFMADWTRRDDRIRAKLAEFGKAGVPMYLIYSPAAPNSPELLPELLTREMVITAFRDAVASE